MFGSGRIFLSDHSRNPASSNYSSIAYDPLIRGPDVLLKYRYVYAVR